MRKQLTLWTRKTSAREAYTCWAHQQANPNLSEIPITQIPDLMQTNAEKGRPMFYGCLKSDYGQALPPRLIHKSQCLCELLLRFPVSNHRILLLISSNIIQKNEERKLAEQETKFGSKSEEELHAYAWKRTHMRVTQRPIHA
ncbi:hypothetical protein PIB30_074091 [Stylosanthes scabra]|uniref:Uncharacterized protein n=1 Tax=Stylosanthes scabra TaxID=79078 RepID=A0ABU6QP56_9FABA|nr:hypothetical protein [Stylosanthes scabra]